MIDVLTRSYTNYRDGANLGETRLTSPFVQKYGLSHTADLLLDDVRGAEGQVLFVSGIRMRDGLSHDVAYVTDMSNNVYAFDIPQSPTATTFRLLWKQHLGNPVITDKTLDFWGINPTWGILSTPVINKATQTIHVVTLSSPDGTIGKSVYRMHCLSLIDGSDQSPPLILNNATYQKFRLGTVARKQRPGLLFDSRNGYDTVFIAFGSFAESASTNQGWVLAVDVTGLKPRISATWVTGTKHPASGIWMGGQGLSMDDEGFIYGMTGNGGFDPPTDFGECFFKLQYTPGNPGSLVCVDWWSPYSDTGRAGLDPTQPSISKSAIMSAAMGPGDHVPNNAMNSMAMPENVGGEGSMEDMQGMAAMRQVNNVVRGVPTNAQNTIQDEDLGSGGALLVPSSLTGFYHSGVLGAGKDGILYAVNKDNMGKTKNSDFAPGNTDGNFAKLLSPPYNFTDYLGGFNSVANPMTIPGGINGFTKHQHSTPCFYKSPDHGWMLFTQGENSPVRAFRVNPDFSITYLACGEEIASGGVVSAMPGGFMTISADGQGTNTAVLWVCMPLNGDANKRVVQGRLVAYGANWVDETTGHLIKLWDSADWNIYFMVNKFNVPITANGKLLVPTYDSRIMVFS